MLATLVFPIADLRPLRHDAPRRLARPAWPDPREREFVRGTGSVGPRRAGAIPEIPNESYACDVSGLLKFETAALAPLARVARGSRPKVPFRRLAFGSHVGGRFEIGISLLARRAFRPVDVHAACATASGTRVGILDWTGPIAESGQHLASGFGLKSSASATDSRDLLNHVRGLEPTLIVSGRSDELDFKNVPFRKCLKLSSDQELHDSVSLSHSWLKLSSGKELSTWFIAYDDPELPDVRNLIRLARAMIARAHSERRVLRELLSEIDRGTIAPEMPSLQYDRLNEAIAVSTRAFRRSRRGVRRTIVDVLNLFETVEGSVLDSTTIIAARLDALRISGNRRHRAVQIANAEVVVVGDQVTSGGRKLDVSGDGNAVVVGDGNANVGAKPGEVASAGWWVRYRIHTVVAALIAALAAVAVAIIQARSGQAVKPPEHVSGHP